MSKSEVIRTHGAYALCALRIPLEEATVPHVWGIGTRFAELAEHFDGEGECDAQLSDDDLDALCAWWLARRGSTKTPALMDKIPEPREEE